MDAEPLFRVVRGTPTAEELAAVVGVLLSTSRPSAAEPVPVSRWRASALPAGTGLRAASGAWRGSALPR